MNAAKSALDKPIALSVQREKIPRCLKEIPRWITWQYERRTSGWSKTPKRADGSGNASTTNPSNWCSFDAADTAYLLGDFDGIGIIISGDDDIIGIDLDAHFSDRGRRFRRDRGRRFSVIVDDHGSTRVTGFMVSQASTMTLKR